MRASRDSITDLGGGRKRIRITVGYDPVTGKQMRISRTIRGSRRAAEEERDRMRREFGGATSTTYARMSVHEFVLGEWLPTRTLRATTAVGYRRTIDNHIAPAFEHVKLRDLTPLHISRALSSIEAPGARLNVYKMLRAAMNLAVRSRIITWNPVTAVDVPAMPEYVADVYTLDELVEALDAWHGDEIEAGLLVHATCGLRVSETCALDWSDLALEREELPDGEVRFRGAADIHAGYHQVDGQRVMEPPKTRRSSRVVAIPSFAVARLLEIRGTEPRIGPLMTDATGDRMTPAGFGHRWRAKMQPRVNRRGETVYEPPVRYVPLKNLRHSKATISLALGVSMHQVSQTLGHVNERTTDAFYNRPERIADHDVAERLDAGVAKARARGRRKASGGV